MKLSTDTLPGNSKKLDWIDAIKAFAIIAILLNHFAESFGEGPWFSSPSYNWPPFSERMANLFPHGGTIIERTVKFLGWLGDMGPGVFIFLSGLTLTLSALNKPQQPLNFYRKRLLRIYPLYITIHVIILVVAKYIFRWDIHFFSVSTFLSLLGLRFTGSLFFYLNPSWWFIWVIIQMYLAFPFLLAFLNKRGPAAFLLVTGFITIASRATGISGAIHSINLYDWMTGLFAGTRLFEFTFGMYLGYLLHKRSASLNNFLAAKYKVLFISSGIYFAGFICSWTYVGSLLSHSLISIGLTGLFYACYQLLFNNSSTKKIVLWVGKNSFSVFLLHQPFMMYASSILKGMPKAVVLIIIILLSFLAGYVIEKIVNYCVKVISVNREQINQLLNGKLYRAIIFLVLLIAIIVSFMVMLGHSQLANILKACLLTLIVFIGLLRLENKFARGAFLTRFLDAVIIISATLFLISENWLSSFWGLIALVLILLLLTKSFGYYVSLSLSFMLLIGGVFFLENYLRKKIPVQVLKWGEYPALQMDSETTYSLIPDKITHLKYDNYNYYVKTNSLGFASEEINLSKKNNNEIRILILGDAFSMPEGLDYDSSYPYLLEQDLRKIYPNCIINVVNGGVTGYGPNEEYAQLEKYIPIVKPDIVLNQFFVNEFDEINISRVERRTNIGFFVDRTFKKKYFGNDQIPAQLDLFAQKKLGIIDKPLYSFKSLIYYYEKNAYYYDDSVINKVSGYFDNMSALCAKHGAKYIVMYVPGQIEVEKPSEITFYPRWENIEDTTRFNLKRPQKIVALLCARKNIPYINTVPYLKSYPTQPVYFRDSWHWNMNGHKAISQYLSKYFSDSIRLNEIKQVENLSAEKN